MSQKVLDLLQAKLGSGVVETHSQFGDDTAVIEPARWREAADEFQRNSGVVRPDIDEHFWQMMSALILADDRAEFFKRLESVVEPDWELLPTDALSLECLGFGMTVGLRNPRFVAERIERRFAQELSNPAQVLVKADFALVLARAGRLTEAEKWIRQALASPLLSTMDRDLMNHKRINLALILALRGDRTGARVELARAEASLGPLHTDGQLLSGVGVANLAMGRAEVETRSVYAVIRREVNELLSSR